MKYCLYVTEDVKGLSLECLNLKLRQIITVNCKQLCLTPIIKLNNLDLLSIDYSYIYNSLTISDNHFPKFNTDLC